MPKLNIFGEMHYHPSGAKALLEKLKRGNVDAVFLEEEIKAPAEMQHDVNINRKINATCTLNCCIIKAIFKVVSQYCSMALDPQQKISKEILLKKLKEYIEHPNDGSDNLYQAFKHKATEYLNSADIDPGYLKNFNKGILGFYINALFDAHQAIHSKDIDVDSITSLMELANNRVEHEEAVIHILAYCKGHGVPVLPVDMEESGSKSNEEREQHMARLMVHYIKTNTLKNTLALVGAAHVPFLEELSNKKGIEVSTTMDPECTKIAKDCKESRERIKQAMATLSLANKVRE